MMSAVGRGVPQRHRRLRLTNLLKNVKENPGINYRASRGSWIAVRMASHVNTDRVVFGTSVTQNEDNNANEGRIPMIEPCEYHPRQ